MFFNNNNNTNFETLYLPNVFKMSEETPQLKRDSTMKVTAEEGAAFLEKHGVKVDDDAKTRAQAQQKEAEETKESESPKLSRTTTMAATAKEGEAILDGADLGKTRSETDSKKEDEKVEEEKPNVPRTTTMEMTAKEGKQILETNGGVVEGTRSQSKKIEEAIKASEDENDGQQNGNVDEEKETNGDDDEAGKLKRKSTMIMTAEEGEEFLKRQKVAEPEEAPAAEVEA